MKKSLTISAKFTAFQKAMHALAGWRNCDCELVGLEQAMDVASHAMKSAAQIFSMMESDLVKQEDLPPLALSQVELAYNAIITVAVVAVNEVGMELECPDQLNSGRLATLTMLEALAPHVRFAWHRELLRPPSDGDCDFSDTHAN